MANCYLPTFYINYFCKEAISIGNVKFIRSINAGTHSYVCSYMKIIQ